MQMNEQGAKMLNDLCEKFGFVFDWTQESAAMYLSDVLKRIVMYEIATSVAWILIALFVVLMIYRFTIYFHQKAVNVQYNSKHSESEIAEIGWFVFGFAALISICVIGAQIFDIVKSLTLPEKIVLEFFKKSMGS